LLRGGILGPPVGSRAAERIEEPFRLAPDLVAPVREFDATGIH
jgi:hypothetical protein